mgnify:CR=1 FL=1
MLDIQFVRENPDLVQEKAKQKGYKVDVKALLKADEDRRNVLVELEDARARRNNHSGQLKQGKPTPEQIEKGKDLKDEVTLLEQKLAPLELDVLKLLKDIPNMPLESVPIGASEDENVVTKRVGEPTKFDFTPKNHAQIAEAKGWLDKERAAKVTGTRFAYIQGDLVKLQFAIIQFVMDKLSDKTFINKVIQENNLQVSNKPFTPVLPPFMIRTDMYDAMDRLQPSDDRYKIEGEELWLQGSAEHVLGSMYADEIIPEAELPIRLIGYATSFRKEAGTYGKDMEGIFRMHQFDKLEMESLGVAEAGMQEHLFMIAIQEKLMTLLGIPYEVMNKCTADIGKPNAHGVDINAWMPGQDKYRETHTADYMTDYQARRLKTRVRRANGAELIHTNDATALPLSRGPVAILENYQNAEGDVVVPEVLRPYMGGRAKI